jgi:hypothetical protein
VRLEGRWRGCVISLHLIFLSFKTTMSEPQRRPKGKKTHIPHPTPPRMNQNRIRLPKFIRRSRIIASSNSQSLFTSPRSAPRSGADRRDANSLAVSTRGTLPRTNIPRIDAQDPWLRAPPSSSVSSGSVRGCGEVHLGKRCRGFGVVREG